MKPKKSKLPPWRTEEHPPPDPAATDTADELILPPPRLDRDGRVTLPVDAFARFTLRVARMIRRHATSAEDAARIVDAAAHELLALRRKYEPPALGDPQRDHPRL